MCAVHNSNGNAGLQPSANSPSCPTCGGTNCQENFHQMLFWEAEFPEYGVVHHLLVLSYHLQHPHLYSREGLASSKQLLVDFLENGLSTEDVRKKNRSKVASDNRQWKITARPDSQGAYKSPVTWTMTAADVVAGGSDNYCENVRQWANSIYTSLKNSRNL